MPCSAIMSIRRSVVFVAGAFPRSPHGPENSAQRNSRPRTTDHSYQGAQGYITAPPQNTYTHEHRHYEKTTVDNITVPAILARILHPIVCLRLCGAPDAHRRRAVTQITALRRCRSSTTTLGRRPRAVGSPGPRRQRATASGAGGGRGPQATVGKA